MHSRQTGQAAVACLVLGLSLLAGCSRGFGAGDQRHNAAPAQDKTADAQFAAVQPYLDFCRTCHVPGGIADVDKGKLFQLMPDRSDDLKHLRDSWERLGGNNPTSRILLMASGQETPHTGGAPWPVGSDPYKAMEALLQCFDGVCGAVVGGGAELLPLLGSSHGGHPWFDYCAGKEDAATLPLDPRARVQPGISDGKAVHFNTWWKDCHVDPELVGERAHPLTCGELRESHARGEALMRGHGRVGAGTFFAGEQPDGLLTVTAENFNRLWMLWGLTARPDNFDQLVAERFGAGFGPERNPYPLPGEDPNQTDGGSGQLPISMTQTHNADGTWSGRIGLSCNGCHSGQVGLPEEGPGLGVQFGSGSPLADIAVIAREFAAIGSPVTGAFALFGTSRGTNNAQFGNIVAVPGAQSTPQEVLGWLTSGSTASMDTPAWWNVGHRPVKFVDGVVPADAVRVDLAFYGPLLAPGAGDSGEWVKQHDQDADHWLLATKSPAYPFAVDQALAEQGAILFHSKDLWGAGLNNPAPKPEGGNGSCASCHGAYSPRFVHDTAFLASADMEGVASNIVPLDVIRTDRERLDAFSEDVQSSNGGGFEGYPETVGTAQDCGAQNRRDNRGNRAQGYLAPPLYGVWATAPYLHNGSVPDVWTLLKPEERPALWRRVSAPARADQQGKVVMGFDVSVKRALDTDKLGWKYDALACGAGTLPFIDCNLGNDQTDPVLQQLLGVLYSNVLLAWNVGNLPALAALTPAQIEDRKIYNTHLFSQSNAGHDFTAVLTDAERRALIEYLKTL